MLLVNNSLLSLLHQCETRTWVRWGQELVMREREEPGPMEVGKVLHRAFAYWLEGHKTEDILRSFEHDWHEEVGEGLPTQERLHHGNVRLVLEHWLLAQEGRVREFETVKSEETFEVPLGKVAGEKVVFYGTIDGLIDWKGERWLLEHKTTGNMDAGW